MAKRPGRVERRRGILTAARTVFTRKGYGATRMSDVAREAAVGKGTLYEYFRGKEDLFSTLLLVTVRESLESLSRPGTEQDPAEALRETVQFVVQAALVENLDLYRLFFDFWGVSAAHRSETQQRLREAQASFREHMCALVRRGQRSGHFRPEVAPDSVIRLFSAAVDGMGMRLVILGETVDLDAYARSLHELLARGLMEGVPLEGASILRDKGNSSED